MRMGWMTVLGLALAGSLMAEETPFLLSVASSKAPLQIAAELWSRAPRLELKLVKQAFVPPMGGGAIESLSVQSLHDGSRIAFRLTWKDATEDKTTDLSNRFVDAVALQLPLKVEEQPTFMMGHQGARVNIWRWKALTQEGERYPKSYADDYYRDAALSRQLPGFLAPFEQLVAEGFGSLTRCKEQNLEGSAQWQKGEWSVVLVRDFASNEGAVLKPGLESKIAFAVWDGSAKERNGQKSLTQWIDFKIEAP